MPVIFASVGYLAGAVIYVSFKGSLSDIPTPDMTSAFDQSEVLRTLISCFGAELKYALILCLLGFCFFGESAGLVILSFKAGLTGFSATYILAGTYTLGIYLIHTLTSLTVLIFLCCICKISGDFSVNHICEKDTPSRGDILSYGAKFFFYCGAIFFTLLIRHLLLTLI